MRSDSTNGTAAETELFLHVVVVVVDNDKESAESTLPPTSTPTAWSFCALKVFHPRKMEVLMEM